MRAIPVAEFEARISVQVHSAIIFCHAWNFDRSEFEVRMCTHILSVKIMDFGTGTILNSNNNKIRDLPMEDCSADPLYTKFSNQLSYYDAIKKGRCCCGFRISALLGVCQRFFRVILCVLLPRFLLSNTSRESP